MTPSGKEEKRAFSATEGQRFDDFIDDIIDQLPVGVLTHVNHFDWSLPGGYDPVSGRLLDGGILIWHVDESVIRAHPNAVNGNAQRRGVDLEEADGAQDIGFTIMLDLINSTGAEGSSFDFWWKENDASVIVDGSTFTLYKNTFNDQTYPNAKTNSLANSNIEFYNFSSYDLYASFYLKTIKSTFTPISLDMTSINNPLNQTVDHAFYQSFPLFLNTISRPNADPYLVVPTQDNISLIPPQGTPSIVVPINNPGQPLIISNNLFISQAPTKNTLTIPISSWILDFYTNTLDKQWETNVPFFNGYLSYIQPEVILLDFSNTDLNASTGVPLQQSNAHLQTFSVNNIYATYDSKQITIINPMEENKIIQQKGIYVGIISYQDQIDFIVIDSTNLTLLRSTNDYEPTSLIKNQAIEWPSIGDIDLDGSADYIFVNTHKNQLYALSSNGSLVENFPIEAPKGARFIGTPIILDIEADGQLDIIIPAISNYDYSLWGWSSIGEPIPGFPLYIGSSSNKQWVHIQPTIKEDILYALSPSGTLKAWSIDNTGNIVWPTPLGEHLNHKIHSQIIPISPPQINNNQRLLKSDKTYLWPNPANESTHIRIEARENAKIKITIIDISGRIFHRQDAQIYQNEYKDIPIETVSWPSGVYVASINASSSSSTDYHLIKLAIIH